jgi:EAL domain-containing protein (putative c-di-GMP-specific phosphodiesterase class I)
LKIDKSFLDDLFATEKNQVILESIIELGHRLKLEIIAESIEKPEQLYILKKLNCNYGQGYLFSRPLGLNEMTRYFEDFPKINVISQSSTLSLV